EFGRNALNLFANAQAVAPSPTSNGKISLYFPVKKGTTRGRQVRRLLPPPPASPLFFRRNSATNTAVPEKFGFDPKTMPMKPMSVEQCVRASAVCSKTAPESFQAG